MADDYTPNMEIVRNAFAAHMGDCHRLTRDGLNEFDRAIATHDAVLIEYVRKVINDPKYGHDIEWVRLNLHPNGLRRIAGGKND